jgi:Tol biopolymer transport system component
MHRRSMLQLALGGLAAALARPAGVPAAPRVLAPDSREKRLANVRQLTAGGSNAEAYFDTSGTRLIFQSTRDPYGCDQIFTMALDGGDVRLLSTGRGRTTCAFFFPDGRRFLYASTHLGGAACPEPPDRSAGYVWPSIRATTSSRTTWPRPAPR